MNIGILGSGMVGRALSVGFAGAGHSVMIGSRNPDKAELKELQQVNPAIQLGSFEQAATFADIALVATAWSGTRDALELAGPSNLAGKIVIDVTNPLKFTQGIPDLEIAFPDSAGKTIQALLPGSSVVKAFNTITASKMCLPSQQDGQPTMWICGNDPQAKQQVTDLLHAFGWKSVVDLGPIEEAYLLEAMAMVWIRYGSLNKTWDHALALLGK